MTSTHPINQMKLLTSIAAAAAVIGASLITVTSAEANSRWKKIYPEGRNIIAYVKNVSRNGNIVSYENKMWNKTKKSMNHYVKQANCSTWSTRYFNDGRWSNWREALPNTVGGNMVSFVCR